MFSNIDEERIKSVLSKYGQIDKIVLVPKVGEDGHTFNSVFIYFKSWNDTKEASELQTSLKNGGSVRVTYDKQWYWIVLSNTSKKNDSNNKPNNKTNNNTKSTVATVTATALPLALAPPNTPLLTLNTPLLTPNTPLLTPNTPLLTPNTPLLTPKHRSSCLPGAPMKADRVAATKPWGLNLDKEFEKFQEPKPVKLQCSDKFEEELEEELENFNLVDADYVYNLEQENGKLRMEITRLLMQQQNILLIVHQQSGAIFSGIVNPATSHP